MGRKYTLVVDGRPVPKERARSGRGHFYTPSKTKHHMELINVLWFAKFNRTLLEGPLKVSMRFFMPDGRPVDIDNLIKLCADSLNGMAWQDDRQIKEINGKIELDKDHPRTEIEVEVLEDKQPIAGHAQTA